MSMSTMKELLKQEHEILVEIADHLGEITENQDKALEKLNTQISEKIDGYVYVLKNKRIEEEIEHFKERKEEIDSAIKELENIKYNIRYRLHTLAQEKGGRIDTEMYTLEPDFNVRRSVDLTRVADEDKVFTFEIPGKDMVANPELAKLERYLKSEKCNVTSLPEEHIAIVKSIIPTIKITKRKRGKSSEKTDV